MEFWTTFAEAFDAFMLYLAAYTLTIAPTGAAVTAHDAAGLTWGLQTLRQLVIANLQDGLNSFNS